MKTDCTYLPENTHSLLKQIVFKDLISSLYKDLYKEHSQELIRWLEIFIVELELKTVVATQLLIAGFGYDWGCVNLYQQHLKHTNPASHLPACFELSSLKVERLLLTKFPHLLSQKELLTTLDLIRDQVAPASMDTQASLLWEASSLSWIELSLQKRVEIDLAQFKQKEANFKNEISKQALKALLAG